MSGATPGLVGIVRDFFACHQLMRRLFDRYRSGELRFPEIETLVSDDESSVLFRLKEHCHALFRPVSDSLRQVSHREVLFDLAVGSLFHEAMKFRESFYQSEVYGPRVRAMRADAEADSDSLFREFERILAGGAERLHEGLQECEVLLGQTREQLRLLLLQHREDGYVARYLVENADSVRAVFDVDLDTLLADLYDDEIAGWSLAGRSYLESGYYDAAESAFGEALARGGDRVQFESLRAYARGMGAYLSGDYGSAVEELERWHERGSSGGAALVDLAHAAVSRIGQLALGADRERLAAGASALAERLGAARAVQAG